MAKLDVPTVRDLYDSFVADYTSRTGQTTTLLRSAFVRVFGWVFAGLTVLCYRFGRWIYLQMFISTCSPDALRLYGYRVGLEQKDGSSSIATVTLTGVTTPALTVPANTTFVNPLTGYTYSCISGASVIDGIANCVVTSILTGENTILNVGDSLTLANAILGLPNSGIVTDVTAEGADAEPDEVYRQRVQTRYRMKAQGGAPGDYWLWSTEVEGIEDAFVYVINPGRTTIYAAAAGSGADRLATAEKLEEVEASCRQSPDSLVYDRHPVQARLNVLATPFVSVDVTITGLTLSANTAKNRADIKQAIVEYLDSRKPEIPALNYSLTDGTIAVSAISSVASSVLNASDFTGVFDSIVVSVNGSPITSKYFLPTGTLANIGTLMINNSIVV
jgi:uncharacterized phage protein gp47/JayE